MAGAFFVGMIAAFVPIPFQMVLAASLAILVRVNIPISVALVWLTNPLTIPPLFFFAYKVGCWVMGQTGGPASFHPSMEWVLGLLQRNWEPFLLGCAITGITLGAVCYVAIHVLWRMHVTHRWRTRHVKKTQHAGKPGTATVSTSRANSIRS